MLRAARAEPDRLVIGVDANASSMRSSARAAERREALSNALFVVSAAESLPPDLEAVADRISVTFPWGSLLRGLSEPRGPVLSELGRISTPAASIEAMWSVTPHDGIACGDPMEIAGSFDLAGFDVREVRPATLPEIEATQSSWAKRLRAGRDRSAYILLATRRVRFATAEGPMM